jgi:hypothetical protein
LYHFESFTTPCELHIEAHSQSEANDIAKTIFFDTKQFEHRYSYFSETSEIYALNNRQTNILNIFLFLQTLTKVALVLGV